MLEISVNELNLITAIVLKHQKCHRYIFIVDQSDQSEISPVTVQREGGREFVSGGSRTQRHKPRERKKIEKHDYESKGFMAKLTVSLYTVASFCFSVTAS